MSFTFDDFPRSALLTGGGILNRFGLAGTYYASFGLMGKRAPTGEIFVREDLDILRQQGHELGCHTFSHCHSWDTPTQDFEHAIVRNGEALNELLPGTSFRTFSYPISPPRPLSKRKAAGYFMCCRGGGQTFNTGQSDLNYLAAFFLEKSRDNPRTVADLIDANRRARGWLVLATHDVDSGPTPFGCTPAFFTEIVERAIDSGARILPVAAACETLCGPNGNDRAKTSN